MAQVERLAAPVGCVDEVPDPEAVGDLSDRYALKMQPESLPELCARFGVWFPGGVMA